MRPENVHHYGGAEFRHIIGADHRHIVLREDVIESRLVFDDVVHPGEIQERPFHIGPKPGDAGVGLRTGLRKLFEQLDHCVLIEPARPEVGILPRAQFKLTTRFGTRDVDACTRQPPQAFGTLVVVDDVDGPVAGVDALLEERQHHLVLVVSAMKKRTHVATAVHRCRARFTVLGPCSRTAASYRAFGFSDGTPAAGPSTQINGLFLPRNQARGQAVFRDYPNCGSATVEWTASRR